jgi:hypothetical protein
MSSNVSFSYTHLVTSYEYDMLPFHLRSLNILRCLLIVDIQMYIMCIRLFVYGETFLRANYLWCCSCLRFSLLNKLYLYIKH